MITDAQKEDWRVIAERTIDKLDFDDHSQEAFLLFGASMAILGHNMLTDSKTLNDFNPIESDRVKTDLTTPPSFQSGNQRIDELLQTIAVNFREYAEAKSDCVARPTTQNESVCNEDLADVLQALRQIFLILRQSANTPEEKEQLRGFHQGFNGR